MDSSAEELRVYSILTDDLLTDMLEFVAAEVEDVLAARARRSAGHL